MKRKSSNVSRIVTLLALILSLSLCTVLITNAVLAESTPQAAATEAPGTGVAGDANPAIQVAQDTANSVVGVATYSSTWSRQTGESEEMIGQGSGVVIQAGYVLTNYHVVEDGTNFKVLLPSGEYIDAELVGTDSSTDLAVLKVDSDVLTPARIGSSSDLLVGSTVIAIGNPGGEVLANTVTSGIVSALERTSVNSSNTTRQISYIQHDAAINSGNSGGGLFNANGELVGINTLKYGGSVFSSVSFEGLGFAIPVDTAYPIAMDLIEHGKVLRPQMGVTVYAVDGPDEAMSNYPPASLCINSVEQGSPAEAAGLQAYDFITEIDGVRVTNLMELTAQLDQHEAGDTVTLTVVRYANVNALSGAAYTQEDDSSSDQSPYYPYYPYPFGRGYGYGYGYGYGNENNYNAAVSNSFETLSIDVTLEVLE